MLDTLPDDNSSVATKLGIGLAVCCGRPEMGSWEEKRGSGSNQRKQVRPRGISFCINHRREHFNDIKTALKMLEV